MQSQLSTIGNAIRDLLRGLARNEKGYKFDMIELDKDGLTLAVTFDRDDYPRIIGKDGGTIDCILRVVNAIGKECGVTINLEVIPPPEPKREENESAVFVQRRNWPQGEITALFTTICKLLFRRAEVEPKHSELMTIFTVNLDRETVRDLAFLFRLVGRKVGRVIQVRTK